MGKSELESSLNALDLWLIAFGVFVAIGVVGESIAGFLHWRRSGELQSLQMAENLALQQTITQLTAGIADANARAAEATARAAEAQLALARFRAPRWLTPEQQAAIVEKLTPFAGQEYALSVAPGKEPQDLMCLFDKVLTTAGWHKHDPFGDITVTTDCGPAGVNTLSDVHVRVAVDAAKSTMDHADAFGLALIGASITIHGGRDPKNIPVPTVIAVMVGAKSQ